MKLPDGTSARRAIHLLVDERGDVRAVRDWRIQDDGRRPTGFAKREGHTAFSSV
jgi:hypothetical protein